MALPTPPRSAWRGVALPGVAWRGVEQQQRHNLITAPLGLIGDLTRLIIVFVTIWVSLLDSFVEFMLLLLLVVVVVLRCCCWS